MGFFSAAGFSSTVDFFPAAGFFISVLAGVVVVLVATFLVAGALRVSFLVGVAVAFLLGLSLAAGVVAFRLLEGPAAGAGFAAAAFEEAKSTGGTQYTVLGQPGSGLVRRFSAQESWGLVTSSPPCEWAPSVIPLVAAGMSEKCKVREEGKEESEEL